MCLVYSREAVPMNPLERILIEDLRRSLEAIAGNSCEGTLEFISAHHPGLRSRIDKAESQLAAERAGLLAQYARWRSTLEDLENLWALAAWEASEPGAAEALFPAA